jgi:hypothetical protein
MNELVKNKLHSNKWKGVIPKAYRDRQRVHSRKRIWCGLWYKQHREDKC